MSFEITEAFVKQFSSNIFHLSQQKGSRLRPAVRNESQNGESKFFERLGPTTAQKKTSRHGDSPQVNSAHSRRRVTLEDYDWGDYVDEQDKIRMLISPESQYAQAAMWAMGRAMDEEIIAAALGNAFGGKKGQTPIALPNTQKVAAFDGTTTTGVNLNVETLRAVKFKFDENDIDENIPRYFAYTASQLQSMLGELEVTSSDFNTVKALVNGQNDSFLGFKFIRTQLLPRSAVNVTYTVTNGLVGAGSGTITAANSRRCFAWAMDGLVLSIGKDMKSRIEERADKSFSTYVYVCMSIGATRIEEEKVVEVICSE